MLCIMYCLMKDWAQNAFYKVNICEFYLKVNLILLWMLLHMHINTCCYLGKEGKVHISVYIIIKNYLN